MDLFGAPKGQNMTDREITLMALDMLVASLEASKRESTYSAIVEMRLAAARRARDRIKAP